MDTRKNDAKEPINLVEIVDLLWTSAEEIGEELELLTKRNETQYAELLESKLAHPNLPSPATREQCTQAAQSLEEKYRELISQTRPSHDEYLQRLKRHVNLLKRVDMLSQQFSRRVRKRADLQQLEEYRKKAQESIPVFVERASRDLLDSERLQKCLVQMMDGQGEELKEWFFMEYLSRYGGHVKSTSRPRPVVELRDKSVSLSGRVNLSPECMSLVYLFSDLETCVSLREVNSDWYHMFRNIEDILRSKLRARNPFIEPGDADLKSYADCVLLFVSRLKWPTVCNLNDMEVFGEPAERRKIVALELGLDQKLPSSFTGMMPLESGITVACDHFFALAAWQSQEFIRDLWDLSSRPRDEPYEVVNVGKNGTVIRYRDIEVTLPPSILPQDITPFTGLNTPVHLGTMIVTVELKDGRMISIPRDKPHYEHGYTFFAPGAQLYQISNVHFARESPTLIHDKAVYRYRFADFESRKMIEYGAGKQVYPVAAYNGCIWWHLMSSHNSLVPTFVDLESPDRIHFQPTRAVHGVSANLFEQSFRERETSQFVVSLSETGIQVVDLDGAVLTEVTGPREEPAARFFPGYWNGRFMAWCMSEEVVRKTTEKVLQEQGVPEEEWGV
ncbi:hypothetical protein CJU90_6081 [Yarrowia sp. C11]|nr:hypothetical protein CJU90_6081 [Yarrowia sp. C11]KAG5370794.1 hypothetical protein CKK34_0921 [Yarrowia sp. E02]